MSVPIHSESTTVEVIASRLRSRSCSTLKVAAYRSEVAPNFDADAMKGVMVWCTVLECDGDTIHPTGSKSLASHRILSPNITGGCDGDGLDDRRERAALAAVLCRDPER